MQSPSKSNASKKHKKPQITWKDPKRLNSLNLSELKWKNLSLKKGNCKDDGNIEFDDEDLDEIFLINMNIWQLHYIPAVFCYLNGSSNANHL